MVIIAAIISGLIGGIIVSILSGKIIWQWQKDIERKNNAIDLSIEALSERIADSYDLELQKKVQNENLPLDYTIETMRKAGKAQFLLHTYFNMQLAKHFITVLIARQKKFSIDQNDKWIWDLTDAVDNGPALEEFVSELKQIQNELNSWKYFWRKLK